jgi:hypothetical protein
MKHALIMALALLSASGASWIACSGPLLKLPKLAAGQGVPAPDGLAPLDEATSHCATLDRLTAEITVSGSVGGHRVRARLLAGFAPSTATTPATPPAPSARLEAVAPFGQPFFIFVAVGEEATLLLPRADRVLEHARSDVVLEALTGLPLGPRELMETLTRCMPREPQATALAAGDDWRVITSPATSGTAAAAHIYLHRAKSSDPWGVVAVVHDAPLSGGAPRSGWRAEYRNRSSSVPSAIRLVSLEPGRFDLQLSLSQVDTRASLTPDTFRVRVPASAQPITIRELRDNGPLAPESRR